ncbi:C-C chemokine receptor type 10 [Chanos chanos]|uniref:C-C chemokine receptor type 10 n=1 Tax=Chanos chanos TaxID=29144 RepID=A0A6J2V2Z7_CHACN|nr:C-C chemokine receptor type 10-like [Chanos chanos]
METDYEYDGTTLQYDLYIDYSTNTDGLESPCEGSSGQEVTIKVFQTTISVVVFLLGVIGNSLVIATFALYRRLRLRSMTDVFLLYLALSDLLLLLTLPLQTAETLMGEWLFGVSACRFNRGMYAVNTYSGLLLLACISSDRYLVVVRARTAHKLRPSMLRYSKLSALLIALISVVLSLPDIIFSSAQEQIGGKKRCDMSVWMEGASESMKLWVRGAQIAGFCVPFAIMLACYCAIGRVLAQGRALAWRRQRTLRLMVALVVLFLLFQLPYTIVLSLRVATPILDCGQWSGMHLLEEVTRSLAYVRCCLNPILYALVGLRFRNDVLRLLHDAGCVCVPWLGARPDTYSSITPSSPAPTTLAPVSSTYMPPKTPALPPQSPTDVATGTQQSSRMFFFPSSTHPLSNEMPHIGWGQR